MAKNISREDVHQAVAEVTHPTIDRTLVELKMIKDIAVKDDRLTLTLALPFLGVPIKDYLINSVREAVKKLGLEVEIKMTEMNQEELQAFLAMEQESWKGSM
jgi:metal-sulfur cluster biosynthetic enzyme